MSSGAALAAAHRRRAGGAKGTGTPGNKVPDIVANEIKNRPITTEALLLQHDKQIDFLRNYQLSNEAHWEDFDGFLKAMSSSFDELKAKVDGGDKSSSSGKDQSVKEISDKVERLTASAATKDEVMQLISDVKTSVDSSSAEENDRKVAKLESEITKLKANVMQLQDTITSIRSEMTSKKQKKGNSD